MFTSDVVTGDDEIVDGVALSSGIGFADDFAVEFIDDSVIDEAKFLELELKGLKIGASHLLRRDGWRLQRGKGYRHYPRRSKL